MPENAPHIAVKPPIQREHVIKIVYYTSESLVELPERNLRYRRHRHRLWLRLITLRLRFLLLHRWARSRWFRCFERLGWRHNCLFLHNAGNMVTNIACSVDLAELSVKMFCVSE